MMMFWWILGVLLIVVLVGWGLPPRPNASKPSAEEIVRQRYARGEIDRETYQHMLADLRGPDAGQHAAHG
jgi:uncharacterized membrane protein